MKNRSPRFKNEFDTVDTVAMRNVSEKRKLKEHLGKLEKELHNNLVRMETEMLSIRLEKTEGGTGSRTSKPNDMYSKGGKSLLKKAGQRNEREGCEVTGEGKADHLSRNLSGSLNSLPKITTTPSFTTKQVLFDYEKESLGHHSPSMQRAKSMETISELGQKQSQAEKRILTSLHSPRSGVKLTSGTRPPTPQARSPTRLSTPSWNQRRRSCGSKHESHRLLVPLPDNYSPTTTLHRVRSVPNVADLANLNALRAYSKGSLNGGNEFKKGTRVEIDAATQNDIQVGKKVSDGAASCKKGNSDVAQSVLGFYVTGFDERGKNELELAEDDVPDQNDMKKIRYLRHKVAAESKETENILSVFD